MSYCNCLKEVIETYSTKKKLDFQNTNYWLLRWPSIVITPLFLKLKISANSVTWASFLTGISAICCMASPIQHLQICAFALVYLANLLDFIDGNIARVKKFTNHYGKFLDGYLGTSYQIWLPLSIGLSLANTTDVNMLGLNPIQFLLIGSTSSILLLLQDYAVHRLKSQTQELRLQILHGNKGKKHIIHKDENHKHHGITFKLNQMYKKTNRLLQELEFPILLPAILYFLDIYFIFYASINLVHFLHNKILIIRKAKTNLVHFRPT